MMPPPGPHLRPLQQPYCAVYGCYMLATYTLFSGLGGAVNSYCDAHAGEELKAEQRQWAQAQKAVGVMP